MRLITTTYHHTHEELLFKYFGTLDLIADLEESDDSKVECKIVLGAKGGTLFYYMSDAK